ncbi:MAG: hypothetical protein NC043_06770 [Muribaculaceae bacterium]|nr:hypothetical protein [Muribaculaceae bacterium]
MKSNDRFSLRRMGSVMGMTVNANRRTLIIQVVVMAMVVIGFILFQALNDMDCYTYEYYNPDRELDPQWDDLLGTFMIMFGVFTCIGASMMMNWMDTRGKRLNTLMVPATQLEKYVARWILYVPVVAILFTVLFLIGDTLRVYTLDFALEHMSELKVCREPKSILGMIDLFMDAPEKERSGNIIVLTGLGLVALQSLFVLGSCIWPKNSFIKTATAVGLSGAVIAVIMVVLTNCMFDFYEYTYPRQDEVATWFTAYKAGFVALILFDYALGYYRFREAEIINRW